MSALKAPGKSPELKAKAAATRHIAPFAAQLAAEFNDGTLHDVRRQAVIDSLVDFIQSSSMALGRFPTRVCSACLRAASSCAPHMHSWPLRPNRPKSQHGKRNRRCISFSICACTKHINSGILATTGPIQTRTW